MKKLLLSLGALSLSLVTMSQTLYTPTRPIKDQGITVKGWGSGSIVETDEQAFESTSSIRVATRNFFQGGIMQLSKPVDMKAAFADKNNLLRFTVKVANMSMTMGGTASGRGGGGSGAEEGGGAGGGGSTGGQDPSTQTELNTVRVIVTTTDGKKSEIYVPIKTSGALERGWLSVAAPLRAISGFDKTNMEIKELAFSGDAVSTFYIGDIRTVNDASPITGDVNYRDLNLALGDEVTLIARGSGGASILKYMWDFDAADGIQMDATGQVLKRKFRRPGTYVITLTIVDENGIKNPYKTTVRVKVNP